MSKKWVEQLYLVSRLPNTCRTWGVKKTNFEKQISISIADVLDFLGLADLSSFPPNFPFDRLADTLFMLNVWKRYNEFFRLPQGFFERHMSVDLVERADERLLPL